jgi:hypothetical protein
LSTPQAKAIREKKEQEAASELKTMINANPDMLELRLKYNEIWLLLPPEYREKYAPVIEKFFEEPSEDNYSRLMIETTQLNIELATKNVKRNLDAFNRKGPDPLLEHMRRHEKFSAMETIRRFFGG